MDKVLHINDYPAEAGGGGAEVVMARTIALLRGRGVTVETFTGADLATLRRTPLRYVDHADARSALAAKLEAFKPDVVHLHNYYHVLSPGILVTLAAYKRRHRLRVVMSAHDYHLICPNSGGSAFRWWSGQRENIEPGANTLAALVARNWDQRGGAYSLLKLAQHLWNYRWHHRQGVIDLIICPSRFVQEMLAPLHLPTCWLPHPVPVAPLAKPNRPAALRFVFAGRIEPEKGLDEFLRMCPDEQPPAFTIIGEGQQLAACRETCLLRNWTERVEFLGRLPHAETLARIADCHVLVQPSRVLETFGLTLIEALSRGTNILAAQRGAACELVVATGVGFLYQPDNPRSLAERMRVIRQSHQAGTLNQFNIGAFLWEHGEQRYLEQLLQLYAGAAASAAA